MELIRREDRYDLYDDNGHKVASTSLNTLSKQNCDEIFGVFDVEKLAQMDIHNVKPINPHPHSYFSGFIRGFNKAMELNKDKLFTLEDMEKAIDVCIELMNNKGSEFRTHKQTIIQSLQQPTEIEIEIEMEDIIQLKKRAGGLTNMGKPKLDSNENLILRKI